MKKLTNTQKIVLNNLDDKWRNAYQLGCSLSTLYSLVRLGLAESKYTRGYAFMPRVGQYFRQSNDPRPNP